MYKGDTKDLQRKYKGFTKKIQRIYKANTKDSKKAKDLQREYKRIKSKPETNQKSKLGSSGIHPAGGLNPDPDPESGLELLRVNGEAAAES